MLDGHADDGTFSDDATSVDATTGALLISLDVAAQRIVVRGASLCTEMNQKNVDGRVDKGRWDKWRRLKDNELFDPTTATWSTPTVPWLGGYVWHLAWRDTCSLPTRRASVWISCLAGRCLTMPQPQAEQRADSDADPDDTDRALSASLDPPGKELRVAGPSACLQGAVRRVDDPSAEWNGPWRKLEHAADWRQGDRHWASSTQPWFGSGRWHLLWYDPCLRASTSLWVDCAVSRWCRHYAPP